MSLNIWGGRLRDRLLEFVKKHHSVDIFCLQEVYKNAQEQMSTEKEQVYALDIFSELQAELPHHRGFFRPVVGDGYGISIFVKRELEVLDEGEIGIYDNPNYAGKGPAHSRNLQWITVRRSGQNFVIANAHGLWNGDKADSPERIAQSQKIREFIDSVAHPVILCGDLNLRPDTESINILEERLENLIRKYNIPSTRTSFYPKSEKFADYIFSSPDLKIDHFQVLDDEISDHAPLVIKIGQ